MDYTQLLSELNKASAFDLYRLSVAITKELDNPNRMARIKQQLRIGMEVSYFDDVENREIKVKLLEIKQKRVTVLDCNNKRITMPYYMLNIFETNTNINETKKTEVLNANTLKVGDLVGFNNDGKMITGVVKKLNYKTATLITSTSRWRVYYENLYRIYDVDSVQKDRPLEIEYT